MPRASAATDPAFVLVLLLVSLALERKEHRPAGSSSQARTVQNKPKMEYRRIRFHKAGSDPESPPSGKFMVIVRSHFKDFLS